MFNYNKNEHLPTEEIGTHTYYVQWKKVGQTLSVQSTMGGCAVIPNLISLTSDTTQAKGEEADHIAVNTLKYTKI